jgi:hypothetical protein
LVTIGTIVVNSKTTILVLGKLPKSYDGVVVSLSSQVNLTISEKFCLKKEAKGKVGIQTWMKRKYFIKENPLSKRKNSHNKRVILRPKRVLATKVTALKQN